ncbi:MAG: suppressor of fused domain protein [Verrucomicrobiae bacterium]|nr:suppressor of fused domain protein [Verrucomicrobiae bacterium]MCB1234060.1 suppressor of fused domain protein [Verrucomicrobiae bacterium]
MEEEKSESGAPIYRHKGREREFEFAIGDSDCIEAISDHIERYIGPISTVFHEVISDLVHIDIHIVEPTRERNFYTLVTSGMSDRPMTPPAPHSDLRFSELLICLPSTWPMGEKNWDDEKNYWPVRILKFLGRFPHEYDTWLWAQHTIPNGDPPAPLAENTKMSAMILLPPLTVSSEFWQLEIDPEKTIHFHAVIPLHEDELALKLREGTEALFDGFERDGVTELLEVARPSSLVRKNRWFPFRFGR